MKVQTLSPKQLRQRKVLLVMPLLVLPFTTLFFWSLGGGNLNAAGTKTDTLKGFNMRLPDAVIKAGKGLDKLSYYDRAAADSSKFNRQSKSDPYYRHADSVIHMRGYATAGTLTAAPFSGAVSGAPQSAGEQQVYQKLAQLQTAINKPFAPAWKAGNVEESTISPGDTGVRKPHQADTSATSGTGDPEMKQMDGMLEKILDIEHPERLNGKPGQKAITPDIKKFEAIPAVIEGDQKITEGTVVRLKLLDTVTISGQLIPRGQLIYGSGTLYNQRLTINIKLIHMGYTILPVDLTVFDMVDGMEGISVPEAVTGDAAKDGAVSGVEGLELMTMDQSVGTQLAGAGVNAAKGLFAKKAKRLKGRLKNGHALLLRDNAKIKQALYK